MKNGFECTQGWEIVLSDVNPGTYRGEVWPHAGGLHLPARFTATVVGDKSITVKVPAAQGGVITTTVTDAATGKPVADVCISAPTLTTGLVDSDRGKCTDTQGKVRVGPVAPGTHTLFAQPPYDLPYGHQWVGSTGGTGDQREAAKITVRAGDVVAGPDVRLDRAGTVRGVVTMADTGKPVSGGEISYTAWDFVEVSDTGVTIGADGSFTLAGLGPYDWPLYVAADNAAPQWSGGVGNRFDATKISVSAGGTTTYSPALATGSVLRGTMTPVSGKAVRLTAYNAVTGDPIGVTDSGSDGTYQMRIVGQQTVKLGYGFWSPYSTDHEGWYDGATSLADATEVSISGEGETVLDLTRR